MSRFFKTTELNPNNSFLYKAPHEFMMKALEVQQQGYDNMMATTELYNTLDIKHINNPLVKDRVQEIKADYEGKANEIAEAIQADPTKWNKLSPKLRQLSARLKEDMTSGSIANIQGSYANYQKFLENNKGKDERVMAMANNYYMNEYSNRASENPDAYMQFDDVVNPVDLMSDKYQKILKEVKANKSMTSDGRYVYENKEITAERAEQIAYGLLMSDPEYQAYANQQVKFGDMGFVDVNEDGSVSRKNVYGIFNNDGEPITKEQAEQLHKDWDALSPEQKKSTPYPFKTGLNMSHSMAGGLKALGSAYSFFERTFEADKYGLQNNQGKIDSQLAAQKNSYDVALERIKHANAVDLVYKNNAEMKQQASTKDVNTTLQIALAKATPGSKEYKNLEAAIAQNNVDSTLGNMYGKKLNLGDVIKDALSGDSESATYLGNSRDYGRKVLGYKEGSDEHNLLQTFDYYMKKGKSKEQAMKSAVEDLRGIYVKKMNYNKTKEGALAAAQTFNNNLYKKNEGLLNKYYNKQNEYLNNLENENGSVRFEPVSSYGKTNLAKAITENSGAFTITDGQGNMISTDEKGKLGNNIDVTDVVGANPYGNIGIKATVNGKQYIYIPNTKNSDVNKYVSNITLNGGLKDMKNSTMIKSITNRELSDIETSFMNTKKKVDGSKEIMYTSKRGGKDTQIYLRSTGSNLMFSTDPNVDWNDPNPTTGKYIVFDNAQHLFDNLND